MDSPLREAVFKKYKGICVFCRMRRATQIHHDLPKSLGGRDEEDNLSPLCDLCHERVHNQGAKNMIKELSKRKKSML